jgi:hypothetical protein
MIAEQNIGQLHGRWIAECKMTILNDQVLFYVLTKF